MNIETDIVDDKKTVSADTVTPDTPDAVEDIMMMVQTEIMKEHTEHGDVCTDNLHAYFDAIIDNHENVNELKTLLTGLYKKKTSDVDRAIKVARVKMVFGIYPHTVEEYVKHWFLEEAIEIDPNGILYRNPKIWRSDEGDIITDAQAANDIEMYRYVVRKYGADGRKPVDVQALLAEMRLKRSALKLNHIDKKEIEDALAVLKRQAYDAAAEELAVKLEFDSSCKKDVWSDFVKICFDENENDILFVKQILQHFVWQVKRKLAGMPVDLHNMPVIYGPQNAGKSTVVRELLKPLTGFSASADFTMIEDSRQIELWRNYVLVFDEMAYASRGDISVMKEIITNVNGLTRKPLYTNNSQIVPQSATFIGTTNKRLADVIKDQTGMRRFAELISQDAIVHDDINAFIGAGDITRLWQTVDEMKVSPLDNDLLMGHSATQTELGEVEEWLLYDCDFLSNEIKYTAEILKYVANYFSGTGNAHRTRNLTVTNVTHTLSKLAEKYPDRVKRAGRGNSGARFTINPHHQYGEGLVIKLENKINGTTTLREPKTRRA
jgi:hypothetical protein